MPINTNAGTAEPWNKHRIIGQKPPLKIKEIWAIRIRLQLAHRARELALFNLAIDSKLRGCDLVQLRVRDVQRGAQVARRAIVMQSKTGRAVQFELTEQTRESVAAWTAKAHLRSDQFLFPSRLSRSPHLSTRQYARLVKTWVAQRPRPGSLRHTFPTSHQGDSKSTAGHEISAQSSFCSVTPSWKVQSDTWALK